MSACPVCGSRQSAPRFRASDRLYRTTTKVFDVVQCGECGLLRLHPQPSPEELRRRLMLRVVSHEEIRAAYGWDPESLEA